MHTCPNIHYNTHYVPVSREYNVFILLNLHLVFTGCHPSHRLFSSCVRHVKRQSSKSNIVQKQMWNVSIFVSFISGKKKNRKSPDFLTQHTLCLKALNGTDSVQWNPYHCKIRLAYPVKPLRFWLELKGSVSPRGLETDSETDEGQRCFLNAPSGCDDASIGKSEILTADIYNRARGRVSAGM